MMCPCIIKPTLTKYELVLLDFRGEFETQAENNSGQPRVLKWGHSNWIACDCTSMSWRDMSRNVFLITLHGMWWLGALKFLKRVHLKWKRIQCLLLDAFQHRPLIALASKHLRLFRESTISGDRACNKAWNLKETVCQYWRDARRGVSNTREVPTVSTASSPTGCDSLQECCTTFLHEKKKFENSWWLRAS